MSMTPEERMEETKDDIWENDDEFYEEELDNRIWDIPSAYQRNRYNSRGEII